MEFRCFDWSTHGMINGIVSRGQEVKEIRVKEGMLSRVISLCSVEGLGGSQD